MLLLLDFPHELLLLLLRLGHAQLILSGELDVPTGLHVLDCSFHALVPFHLLLHVKVVSRYLLALLQLCYLSLHAGNLLHLLHDLSLFQLLLQLLPLDLFLGSSALGLRLHQVVGDALVHYSQNQS